MTDEQKKLVQQILEAAEAIKAEYSEAEIGCESPLRAGDRYCIGCAISIIKRNAKLLTAPDVLAGVELEPVLRSVTDAVLAAKKGRNNEPIS